MIIGPDEILRCPSCHALMSRNTYDSFGTFKLRYWSDGHVEGLPDRTVWTLCPGCKKGWYVDDLEVLGLEPIEPIHYVTPEGLAKKLRSVREALNDRSLRTWLLRKAGKLPSKHELREQEARLEKEEIEAYVEALPESSHAPGLMELNAVHYKHLLKRGAHGNNEQREISLRTWYWRTLNHPVRRNPQLGPDPLEDHHQNLRRLEELLLKEGSPDVSIVALRMELGRFDEAREYLATLPVSEQTQEQRDAFSAAIDQRVDRVFRIK